MGNITRMHLIYEEDNNHDSINLETFGKISLGCMTASFINSNDQLEYIFIKSI